MNEEIKQALDYFNGWCEEGTNITITSDFIENVELLNDYIANLQEENKELKGEIFNLKADLIQMERDLEIAKTCGMDSYINYLELEGDMKYIQEENQKLVNVINELEEYIKSCYIVGHTVQNASLDDILNKLTELKGDNND